MKVLHVALMKHYSSGIVNQMYSELTAAKKQSLDLDVKIFTPYVNSNQIYDEIFKQVDIKAKNKISEWFEFRNQYYAWIQSIESNYDYILIRYSTYDPLLYKYLKNTNAKVYLVHHTLELQELKLEGLKGYLKASLDIFFGNKSLKLSYGIIGVTDEIVNFEKMRINQPNKRAITYSNGIFISNDSKLSANLKKQEIPEVIFIASYFYPWHGLDLLIEAVKSSKENIIIHLVGEISESDLNKIKLDKRFVVHGKLSQDEIFKLSNRCIIGLGSFALFRKNMNQACTLKVREYLSVGLPVYSGHFDIFPKKFIFYEKNDLNLDKIIKFINKMEGYSKPYIINESLNYISKEMLIKKLFNDLGRN